MCKDSGCCGTQASKDQLLQDRRFQDLSFQKTGWDQMGTNWTKAKARQSFYKLWSQIYTLSPWKDTLPKTQVLFLWEGTFRWNVSSCQLKQLSWLIPLGDLPFYCPLIILTDVFNCCCFLLQCWDLVFERTHKLRDNSQHDTFANTMMTPIKPLTAKAPSGVRQLTQWQSNWKF